MRAYLQQNICRDDARHRPWQAARDFLYGLTGYVFVHHARAMKQDAEALFLLSTFGDMLGLPIMPPACALRLLPYAVPKIATWKRRLASPNEFWEREELHLHGL